MGEWLCVIGKETLVCPFLLQINVTYRTKIRN